MSEEKRIEHVIIAPHYDDEIIGCWEILNNPLVKPIIIYMQDNKDRQNEAIKLKTFIERVQIQLFQRSIPSHFLNPSNVLYFPDHIFEFHPDHRKWGATGEEYLRQGLNVIYYSINMQAPYIHEVKDFKGKRHLLEKVYPSQKSLWKNEAKYYLFEGYCKWIM